MTVVAGHMYTRGHSLVVITTPEPEPEHSVVTGRERPGHETLSDTDTACPSLCFGNYYNCSLNENINL